MAKVSVIIPTYQSAQYIRDALDSVLNQTYQNIEIIVVNDGSTDNTEDILDAYEGKISVISQANSGPGSARNIGILASCGEFIALLDADDIWMPDKLEKQIKYLHDNPSIGLVFSDSYIFHEKKLWAKTHFQLIKPSSGNVFRNLFIENFIPNLTVVARRQYILAAGLFEPKFVLCEDYGLWIEVSKITQIAYINEPLAKYRIHQGQLSSQEEKMISSLLRVKEKAFEENSSQLAMSMQELDRVYFNLILRYAKILKLKNEVDKAKTILDTYQTKRGITLRLSLYKIFFSLPHFMGVFIFTSWDKLYSLHLKMKKRWS